MAGAAADPVVHVGAELEDLASLPGRTAANGMRRKVTRPNVIARHVTGRNIMVVIDQTTDDTQFNGQKWGIVNRNPTLLDRGDQVVALALALKHRGEQFHQRRPTDWRFQVIPGAIRGDAHV